ncbi:MAG: biopolymer transporter ExbD [Planctomycetes bacterium]|nr:biopolymer transporter ExbD [Planctomycetota bacterium]
MALKKKPKPAPECKMQMTSMIDVVFLLIIFFMLVTEMTKIELEDIILPTAVTGESEVKDPKNRLIINITWDPRAPQAPQDLRSRIVIQRRVHKLQALRTRLENVVKANPQENNADGPPTSEVLVKIRADSRVPYKHVMTVMAQCARVFIYKISFATKEVKSIEAR